MLQQKTNIMRKFNLPIHTFVLVLILFLVRQPSFAQSNSENRPLGIGRSSGKTLEGEIVINQKLKTFFESIAKKEVKTAFENLLSGSKIGDNREIVDGLVERTDGVLQVYGTMADFEPIRTDRVGNRLARIVYISYGEAFPLQWEFYCYRSPDEKWQVLDITVNNDLDQMFGDEADVKPRIDAAKKTK
jgi:hypothetical protein